jgi:hypothetical protein
MIKYLNIIMFIVTIGMNYLANALPLNNHTTGQLSDSYPNLFVPAGVTFSIWGVIYLLLAGFCTLQFMGSGKTITGDIGWLFTASCVLNALWIVCWHYEKLPLSLIVMIGLLITLIYINIILSDLPSGIIKASFGIYLGWICIATIANVTALLVHYRWNGFGISEVNWTIILISAGALIAALTLLKLNNPFIGLSVIWAFAGIMLKRKEDYRSIVITALIALIVVAAVTLWGFITKASRDLT